MSEGRTTELYERARAWAQEDQRVAAALVYGSVAHGHTHDLSDLDLLIVARQGQRNTLWHEREALAARILGMPSIFQQEPSWQRPFRFQAWRADLMEVDLTFDESSAVLWEGLARGFVVLVDRDGVADRLRSEAASWQPSTFDAAAFDQGTWPWLLWLVGRLRHGQYWMVRYGVMDTLTNRVLPLLGAAGPTAEQVLEPSDLEQLYQAAPRSATREELARALCATTELYNSALDRWAARTSQTRPTHPLSPGVLDLVRTIVTDSSR